MIKHIGCLVVLATLLWSCTGGNNTKQANEGGKKVFRYNQTGGLTSLDPAYAGIRSHVWATSQIYNGLFGFSKTLDPHPELVHQWEVSEDGKTYTFTIKSDIRFHDNKCFSGGRGRELIAEDFVYSFKRILKEGTAGAAIFSDKVITNPDGTPSDTCFKTLDAHRFRVYLKRRFAGFLQILATPYTYVVPKEAVELYGKEFGKNPVGTGAFAFKNWDAGQKIALVKNPHYWERDSKHQQLPYLDAVEITLKDDRNTEFLEFKQGNLHFLCNISESSSGEILKKSGAINEKFERDFNVQKIPYLNTEYVGFLLEGDEKTNPLKNLKVRQALSHAINRKELVSFRRNGLGMPADYGFVPFALPSFDSTQTKGYPYNPKKAQELLKEAGYPEGKGLVIKLNTYSSDTQITEQLLNDWKYIGINVKVETNQFVAHHDMVRKGEANMFRGSWLADYPDAENYLTLGYSKNIPPQGSNYFRFKNTEFDKLLEEAHESDNLFTRYDDYKKMDQILMDNAVLIPLYYDEVLQIKQPYVVGLDINAMNNLTLKNVDFKTK